MKRLQAILKPATASVYILISINKVANQFSHYFVRNILLFTTTA